MGSAKNCEEVTISKWGILDHPCSFKKKTLPKYQKRLDSLLTRSSGCIAVSPAWTSSRRVTSPGRTFSVSPNWQSTLLATELFTHSSERGSQDRTQATTRRRRTGQARVPVV